MSDDPRRLRPNLEPTATALGTSTLARHNGAVLVRPVAVQGSRHGSRRAHRSPAQGRDRTRRRPIAVAHRRARFTTSRVRRSYDAHPCVDDPGVRVGAAAAVEVSRLGARRSSAMEGAAARVVAWRPRMRWTKAARIDRPVALRAPRYDHGDRAFPVHHCAYPPYPVNPGELRFASAIAPGRLFPAEAAPLLRLDPAPRPRSSRAIASITPPRASR